MQGFPPPEGQEGHRVLYTVVEGELFQAMGISLVEDPAEALRGE